MVDQSVQEYIARQPEYDRQRRWMFPFFRWLSYSLMWRVQVTGTEHIPASGPTILIINHISAIDPILAIGAVTTRYVIPMSKIENLESGFARWLLINWGAFVIRRNEVDRKALLSAIELLKSGQMILLAPEGTRHPQGLQEARDGMAYIATKSNAMILPLGIAGEALLWKDKLRRLQQPLIQVNIGRPFRFKTQEERAPRGTLSQMTTEAMYQLAAAIPDPALRGVYSDLNQSTTDTLEFV